MHRAPAGSRRYKSDRETPPIVSVGRRFLFVAVGGQVDVETAEQFFFLTSIEFGLYFFEREVNYVVMMEFFRLD